MQEQLRRDLELIHPVNRKLQRAGDILVRFFGETDVAVADLREAEIAGLLLRRVVGTEHTAAQDSAASDAPDHGRPDPRHAFQKSASVDSIITSLLDNLLGHDMLLFSRIVARAHFTTI